MTSEDRLWFQLGSFFVPIIVLLPCGEAMVVREMLPVLCEILEEN